MDICCYFKILLKGKGKAKSERQGAINRQEVQLLAQVIVRVNSQRNL